MKTVIVYSSATGNTARLAQELSAQLNLPAMPLAEAEGWQDADRILAGFWTDKGSCDEKMAAFLSGLAGRKSLCSAQRDSARRAPTLKRSWAG